jgi:integrase
VDSKMMNLNELALTVTEAMQKAGYSNVTAWKTYLDAYRPLIRFHEKRGLATYDPMATTDFCNQIQERRLNGTYSRGNATRILAGISRLRHYCDTGRIDYEFPKKVSSFKLSGYYEVLLNDYLSFNEMHPKTRSDTIWITRKFFAWAGISGHPTLDNLTSAEIQAFMVHCSEHMASASVHNVQLYLRKLFDYLYQRGRIDNPFTALLSIKVSRESKLYPATTHAELAAIFNEIDRSSMKGKRDYAIILLGAILGLRAVDVIKLKLTDINWQRGDITIVQAKTGKTVALPLTEDVGSALREYILHGRRPSNSDIVFQRYLAPFGPFADASSIGDMFDEYRKKAGLSREAFDGKCFHSLRRALGTNMITAGVTAEDTAQTMGDAKIESIKKYVKLDSPHLAECALDFNGIEIGGGRSE